jgi:hypothetical protein
MRFLKLFAASMFFSVLLYFGVFAQNDITIVLQNGLNEYSGCTDSYISNTSSSNNGTKTELDLLYELCSS